MTLVYPCGSVEYVISFQGSIVAQIYFVDLNTI